MSTSTSFTYVGGTNQEDLPPRDTTRLIVDPSALSLCYYLSNLCNDTLQQVIFPKHGSLRQIDASAFSNCRALRSIDIPGTVETIGEDAFYQCTSLKHVNLSEGLKQIEKEAFYCCSSLETANFSSTLNMIGTRAFYECRSLTTIKFTPKPAWITDHREKEVYICKEAFLRCSGLTRVIQFPYSWYMKDGIFKECESLRFIDLPVGLQRIEERAFDQCSSLMAISIPSTVKWIEPYAFRGCVSLVSVEIYPNYSLILHGENFQLCKSLCNISTKALSEYSTHHDGFEGCDLLGGTKGALLRFHDLPIHEQCYQAPLSQAKDLRSSIAWMRTKSTRQEQVTDKFGMTPFHVLLSSAKPRADLLEVLLEEYPPHLLGWKDVLGNRPFDYLIRNYWSDDANRCLEMALNKWVVDWMSTWGLPAWRHAMQQKVKLVLDCDVTNEKGRQTLFNVTHMMLSLYEKMEAKCLLELWLWKMEMHSSEGDDRMNAHARCGAPFVIPNVMGFFGSGTSCQPSL